MEIEITSLFRNLAPRDYAASAAELGDKAGEITWQHAREDAADNLNLLDTEEKKSAFRSFVKNSGGWGDEEINAWNDEELTALFIQWISGDCREMFPNVRVMSELTEADWLEAEREAENGSVPSNIYRGDDGRIYFYAGV